jgi:ABC-type antimicrobial peptide transport system permease subunit
VAGVQTRSKRGSPSRVVPAVADLKPLDQLITEDVALDRLHSILLGALAIIALGLAATGLYGLIAYTVAQRTREIGIRLAFGASTQNVRTMMLREMAPLVAVGISIGLAVAVIAARALRGLKTRHRNRVDYFGLPL